MDFRFPHPSEITEAEIQEQAAKDNWEYEKYKTRISRAHSDFRVTYAGWLEQVRDDIRILLKAKLFLEDEKIKLAEIYASVRDTIPAKAFDEIVQEIRRSLIKPERLKLEIKNLQLISDYVEQRLKIGELASRYQISRSEVERMLRSLDTQSLVPKAKCQSLDDFFNEASTAISWLIPELLPKGETVLLVSAPKDGKTLLAIDAAFAVATGESEFLNRTVPQGKVLFVSVDESAQSTRAKLLKRGFRTKDAANVRVMSAWDVTQMQALETQLEDFRPDLVVIDSLKRITAGREISENSAEFANIVYRIKESLTRYGSAGILIHHTNKNQESLGVGRARGSSAIAGACWGQWQIDRIPVRDPNNKKKMRFDPKDPRRVFSAFNRDSDGVSLAIEFNPENNSWECQGEFGVEEEQAQAQTRIRDRILTVMRLNEHRQLSGKDIVELLEDEVERKSIYSELNRMVAKRLISCRPAPGDKRFNLYSLPNQITTTASDDLFTEKSDPSPPPHCVPIADYSSETLTTSALDNSLQLVGKQSATFSPKSETPDVVGVFNSLQNNSLQEGGSVEMVVQFPEIDDIPQPDWEQIAAQDESAEQEYLAAAPAPTSTQDTELTEADIQDFADMIRYAIANPEATEGVQETLTTFFANNPGDKRRAWLALSLEEQSKFKALLEKPCEPKQLTLIDVPPIVESRWAGDDWA